MIGCDIPSAGGNTATVMADYPYTIGSTYTYTCASGYTYNGDAADLVITCQTGRTWSPSPPSCSGRILFSVTIHSGQLSSSCLYQACLSRFNLDIFLIRGLPLALLPENFVSIIFLLISCISHFIHFMHSSFSHLNHTISVSHLLIMSHVQYPGCNRF